MHAASRGVLVASALASLLASCSLTQSLDGYSGGSVADAGTPTIDAARDATALACDQGFKACSGACVPDSDPAHGCGAASCAPCAFPHADVEGCSTAQKCLLGKCADGYADCDGDPANGCEVHLGDDGANCGACGHTCALANAATACVTGACAVAACDTGFGDCNGVAADGCEVATSSDLAHCGSCTTPCPTVANTTFSCTGGACAIAACAATALSCNGDALDGCECAVPHATVSCSPPPSPVLDAGTPDGGAADGGDAGSPEAGASDAAASVDAASAPDASTGVPGCYFVQCEAPYADCDANRANGCETDVTSDGANCGACGASCGGGACVSGRCQPVQIIGNQGNPGQLVIDRDYAYWTNYGAGTIFGSVYSVRKDGANPTPIAGGSDQSQNGSWGIATDYTTSSVYWTTYTPTASHVGSSFKIGGGVATVQATTGRLRGALLDGSYLYYANYEANTLVRLDLTQSPPTALTVAQAPTIQRPNTIVADGTLIYVANEGTPTTSGTTNTPGSAAKSGTVVAITKASIGGTLAVTTFATGLDRPRGLAVDDAQVYWSNVGATAGTGSIQSVAKGGGTPATLASALAAPREIAICSASPATPDECADDPYVYWTEFTGGNVSRVRKDAQTPATPFVLAPGQKSPIGIAVDGHSVFWANYGTSGVAEGTIQRLAKPR
jgi:hypothetical protein